MIPHKDNLLPEGGLLVREVAALIDAPESEVEARTCIVCGSVHRDGTPAETTLCDDCYSFNEVVAAPKYNGTLGVG